MRLTPKAGARPVSKNAKKFGHSRWPSFFLGNDFSYDEHLNGFCRYLISPRRVSPNTWKSYAYTAAEYLDFSDARGVQWLNADNEHLIDYFGIKTRGTATLQKVEGQTWNHIQIVLVHMYEYALRKKLISQLPFSYRISRSSHPRAQNITSDLSVKSTPPSINFISTEQFKNYWRPYLTLKVYAERNIALIELLICSGFRISEALGLTIYNIPDPDSSAYARRNVVPVTVIGKGNKKRTVPIPKRIIRAIQFYIEEDREVAVQKCVKKYGSKMVPTKVFLSESGSPLTKRMVEDIFQEASKVTGIKLTPHGCRHIYSTMMLSALIKAVRMKEQSLEDTMADKYETLIGDPLHTLQKLLGHKSIETVFTYLELTPESREMVEEALINWTEMMT
ncbi:tyrosine-type recombinase/integrase [Laribacter hongkongensis]|uniref:tyrosine-type recombinase/integrase n=1 Tax=Laribacter hongkongensis TaxID=168471 RepID=UPI0027E4B000|nr:tyrosine-type recombinase/integrase [Laribacter hongkongensis]MCG9093554.1 tyrosine-type recombinase/integrase [Laribacter hongkongensis]